MFSEFLSLQKTRYQYTEVISEALHTMLSSLLEWCAEYDDSLENLVADPGSSFWAAVKDPDGPLTEADAEVAKRIVVALSDGELSERPYIFSLSGEFAPRYTVIADITCQCEGDDPDHCIACLTGCDWTPGEVITLGELSDSSAEIDIAVVYGDGECRFEAGFVVDGDGAEDDPYTKELGSGFFYYNEPIMDQQVEFILAIIPECDDPQVSVETLAEWAIDENEVLRKRAAAHPATPVAILVRLAEDSAGAVVAGVVDNPNITVQVLEGIGQKRGWQLTDAHCAVAAHPLTPVTTLELLATHRKDTVRSAVAGNPNTPNATRQLILEQMQS